MTEPGLARVALTAGGLAVCWSVGTGVAGDVAAGRTIFERQCAVCHTTEPEFHKEGPSLAGVYGRRAGSAPFYGGYKALRGADFVWDARTLDAWLADPRRFVDGKDTRMTLHLDDPRQRQDVIAYLKTLR